MSDLLYDGYQKELRYLHQLLQEFRRDHPGAADRLRLEPSGGSSDPNLERLFQSYALLAGRTHAKIHDEFPELTDALLQVLYPHYLAPIPSMFITQFEGDPARLQIPQGFQLPRGSYVTAATEPVPSRFRTAYPVKLWPLRLTEARFQPPPLPAGIAAPPGAAAALRLTLQCTTELKWPQLQVDQLRFYLHGDPLLTADLYEALFRNAIQVAFRSGDTPGKREPVVLSPAASLAPVGFADDENLLPYGPHARLGYRLLTELFTFPLKFQFFDLTGWQRAGQAHWGESCEVIIFFDQSPRRLEQGFSTDNLRLGCTPVVNLFEETPIPIKVRPLRHEYRVVADPDNPLAKEVYAVERVQSVEPSSHRRTDYPPFHWLLHDRMADTLFWQAQRRRSLEKDDRGTDVFLSLTNLQFEPRWPQDDVLEVSTLCTNRDLPAQLATETAVASLRLELAAPVRRASGLHAPTPALRPPARRGGFWRLISHLSPNYLSLQHPTEALPALREMLQLYDFSDPDAGQQHLAAATREIIDGLVGLESRRILGRVPSAVGHLFCRGVEVTVQLDREKFTRTGVLLFAEVLERFFSLYVTSNSFTQLVARARETVIKKWPPRAGAVPTL